MLKDELLNINPCPAEPRFILFWNQTVVQDQVTSNHGEHDNDTQLDIKMGLNEGTLQLHTFCN